MSQETMNKMIGRALIDQSYRQALLRSPRKATRRLPLTREERKLIVSVRAASLEEFSRKVTEALPGSRLLEGRFTAVQQAIGTPRGREAGARYLCEFAEEIKASGLLAQAIARHNVRGVSVAPLASAQ